MNFIIGDNFTNSREIELVFAAPGQTYFATEILENNDFMTS